MSDFAASSESPEYVDIDVTNLTPEIIAHLDLSDEVIDTINSILVSYFAKSYSIAFSPSLTFNFAN